MSTHLSGFSHFFKLSQPRQGKRPTASLLLYREKEIGEEYSFGEERSSNQHGNMAAVMKK